MFFCVIGGVTFAVAIHKVTDLIMLTLQEVFHSSYEWLETAEILSTASGCLVSALSILIFASTSISIYHQNVSGNSQLVFMFMIYPSLLFWGLFLALIDILWERRSPPHSRPTRRIGSTTIA